MTDEHTGAGSATASPESTEWADDRYLEALDAFMALKDAPLKVGASASDVEDMAADTWVQVMLAFALGNFSVAFIQALGQRAADGAAKQVSDLVRTRVRRKGKPDEARIGVADGSAATIAITADTPDEARLALLDLDVTADELRGKLLRWDSTTSAWRPSDD